MLWDQLRFTRPQLPTINWNFVNNWTLFRSGSVNSKNILADAHHTVFASIADGVLILDQDNMVISTNPAARKIIQAVSPSPTPTTDMLDNRHVTAILAMWPSLKAYLNSTTREYVTSVQSSNRDVHRSFDLNVTPIFDKEGQFTGRIILIQETTERENAVKALKQRKQQLRQMVERLQSLDRKRTYVYDGLDVELHSSLTRIDLHLNNLRKGIDDGFNEAINRLEQEISNLYKRFESVLEGSDHRVVAEPKSISTPLSPQLSSAPSKTLA